MAVETYPNLSGLQCWAGNPIETGSLVGVLPPASSQVANNLRKRILLVFLLFLHQEVVRCAKMKNEEKQRCKIFQTSQKVQSRFKILDEVSGTFLYLLHQYMYC